MAAGLTIWTYDWVPNGPRGHVRDIRLRCTCAEARLPFAIATVRFEDRTSPDHLGLQPFARVPALRDGDITLFESGACLLHLADKSDILRVPKLRVMLGAFQALEAYVTRILERPAFQEALGDQLDHFAAADAARQQALPRSARVACTAAMQCLPRPFFLVFPPVSFSASAKSPWGDTWPTTTSRF
jgi:hypothetical protein